MAVSTARATHMRLFNSAWLIYLFLFVVGASISLAFAPFRYWPISLIAIAIFYSSLHLLPKSAFLKGTFFGAGLFLTGLHWVFFSMQTAGVGIAIASLLTAAFCLGLALLLGLFAHYYHRYLATLTLFQPLTFALMWWAFEWVRSWLFTAMPWLLLADAHSQSWFTPYLTVIGSSGLSFVIALIATLFASALTNRNPTIRSGYLTIMLILIALAPLATQINKDSIHTSQPLKVSIIQGNIDQDDKWMSYQRIPTLMLYSQLTRTLPDSDLIVWPETAMPVFADVYSEFVEAIDDYARNEQQGILSGVLTRSEADGYYREFNSMIAMGTATGTYSKQHLVPFGEILPFEEVLRGLIGLFDIPFSSFSAGSKQQAPIQIQLGDKMVNIASVICYEIAFDELTRQQAQEAQVIVTISNDAWFGTSAAPHQHLQIAKIRAIENGLPVIRATQNGISAIIDAQGNELIRTAQFEEAIATTDVQLAAANTFFHQHGKFWVVISLLSLLAVIAVANWRARKQ